MAIASFPDRSLTFPPSISRRRALKLSALAALSHSLLPRFVYAQETPAAPDWAAFAELAQRSLADRYWDDSQDLFHSQVPENPAERRFDYWWQAQALDVLVDGYERTQNRGYLERGQKLLQGILRRNGGLTNEFYDDMLWLALALQRMNRHVKSESVAGTVRDLWKDIQTGKTEQFGGGFSWCKTQREYKSVPANAPAVILAARLYQESKRPEDLETAESVFAWLQRTLVDPETGLIWDGINRKGDGRIDKDWIFSYNQGTFLGAALELHRTTGNPECLVLARRTAEAAKTRLIAADGILREDGLGDGSLFKGIFVRYLGELARYDRDRGGEDTAFLSAQAKAAWARASSPETPVFPSSWRSDGKPRGEEQLGPQLSAIALLEQAAACAG